MGGGSCLFKCARMQKRRIQERDKDTCICRADGTLRRYAGKCRTACFAIDIL